MTRARILVLTGPRSLEYIETDIPAMQEGDILIETVYSGISHGTEMNVYRGVAPQWTKYFDSKLRLFLPVDKTESPLPARGYYTPGDAPWGYPLAYGYANVSRVMEIGASVENLKVGDLVYTYTPHQTLNVVPATSAIKLPDLADPAEGVMFANMNTAYNGVLDTDFRLDDTVVVFGQGIVGLLVTQYLRQAGANNIISVDGLEKRRELSLSMGANESLDPASVDVALHVRELTDGRGADAVIEVSGSYAALQEAIRTAAPNTTVTAMSWYGGTGEQLALSDEFHHNRITIKSSQVGAVDAALSATHSVARRTQQVSDSFGSLDLKSMITNRVPFAEAATGYQLVDSRHPEIVQVVLDY